MSQQRCDDMHKHNWKCIGIGDRCEIIKNKRKCRSLLIFRCKCKKEKVVYL